MEDDRGQRQRPGRLILVIEDDPSFMPHSLQPCARGDFDCVIAHTNDEGMALARDLSPSGILLDVNLPDGSGLTLLDRLKRNPDTRHIPVHGVVSDRAQTALELGAVGFALKPVQRDEPSRPSASSRSARAPRPSRPRCRRRRPAARQYHRAAAARRRDDPRCRNGEGRARAARAESFDCVVLDLNLPDASGYEILEMMSANERYSFPPVIIYTGGDLAGRRGTTEAVFDR